MLEVLTPSIRGGPCERSIRGTADRRYGSAPAAVGAGADDRVRRASGDGADLQRPGVSAAGDGPRRRVTRGRARGNLWLVLGRGHPRRTRRAGASGAPVGGEDVLPAPGEERRPGCRGPGGSAADGPAARGVDRAAGHPGAARLGAASGEAGRAALGGEEPGPRRARGGRGGGADE